MIEIETRHVHPNGWISMKARFDNGRKSKRHGRKVSWWLNWNINEERFAENRDYRRAIADGHRDLLEAVIRHAKKEP